MCRLSMVNSAATRLPWPSRRGEGRLRPRSRTPSGNCPAQRPADLQAFRNTRPVMIPAGVPFPGLSLFPVDRRLYALTTVTLGHRSSNMTDFRRCPNLAQRPLQICSLALHIERHTCSWGEGAHDTPEPLVRALSPEGPTRCSSICKRCMSKWGEDGRRVCDTYKMRGDSRRESATMTWMDCFGASVPAAVGVHGDGGIRLLGRSLTSRRRASGRPSTRS